MAEMRGINPYLMDDQLRKLITEAQSIELRVETLLNRLNMLSAEIQEYKKPIVNPNISTIVDKNKTQTAHAAPQQILPVADRKPEQQKVMAKPALKIVKKAKPAVKKLSNKKGVVNVRYGTHKDKTRLVFDMNGSTKHEMVFDEEVGIVTVTLPQTGWATLSSKTYNTKQIAGYEAKKMDSGAIIAMAVKNTSSVKTHVIGKTKSKPARLIVDLMR